MVGDDIIEKAQQIGTNALKELNAIRSNDRLTPSARTEDIDRLRDRTKDQLATLKTSYETTLSDEYARLERKILAPAPTATGAERVAVDASFRDALSRARDVPIGNDRALMELYSDAARVGDELQQRAALVVALDRGVTEVVSAWADFRPGVSEDLASIQELDAAIGGGGTSNFVTAGNFVVMF